MSDSLHWAIVGGGMLGMTLAYRLRQRGHDVTLFEAAPELGGLACSWQIGDVRWDRHYHVILLSDRYLLRLLDELGLASELEWRTTRTGFYTDGRLYSMSNAWEFLRFPPLGLWDKLRLGFNIFLASRIRNWKPLEEITAADWLLRWSGPRVLEKIWLPLLRAKLGENYRAASAAFIWAIIARMYAARRTGLKQEMFGYVRGGYARILERFAERLQELGVRIELGRAVQAIRSAHPCPSPNPPLPPLARGGRTGGAVVEVATADGRVGRFDRAIVTTPCPIAARICEGLTAEEHARLDAVRYQGIICASVLLRKPLAGFYVTNITEGWVPFTGVIEMTALVDPQHLHGRHLVYLPKYVPADDSAFEQGDQVIGDTFLQAMERMYPHISRDDVLAFQVSRVRHVLAISTLRYSAIVPPMKTTAPGLFLVNSSQIVNGTLNVNEVVQLAERAVEQLAGQESYRAGTSSDKMASQEVKG
jgi:protoporphyrinogen oxidase